MMICHSIFVFILVQSSLANLEDSYSETPENFNVYSDEFLDPDEADTEKRDHHFMRLGRNIGDYKNREFVYDDYDDVDEPIKRGGSQHIRFGRSLNSFMRLGRAGKNKSHFMRMGRSYHDNGDKSRSKRSIVPPPSPDTDYIKRKDIFLRFGKSPSFMRYGRGEDSFQNSPLSPVDYQLQHNNNNDPLVPLLEKLLARRDEGSKRCDNIA